MKREELWYRLDQWACKGNKFSRRRKLAKIKSFLRAVGKDPGQIGVADVKKFYAAMQYERSTARDYHSAISLLWEVMGRRKEPPTPENFQDSDTTTVAPGSQQSITVYLPTEQVEAANQIGIDILVNEFLGPLLDAYIKAGRLPRSNNIDWRLK